MRLALPCTWKNDLDIFASSLQVAIEYFNAASEDFTERFNK